MAVGYARSLRDPLMGYQGGGILTPEQPGRDHNPSSRSNMPMGTKQLRASWQDVLGQTQQTLNQLHGEEAISEPKDSGTEKQVPELLRSASGAEVP